MFFELTLGWLGVKCLSGAQRPTRRERGRLHQCVILGRLCRVCTPGRHVSTPPSSEFPPTVSTAFDRCQLEAGKWKRWTGRVSVVKDAEEEGRREALGC